MTRTIAIAIAALLYVLTEAKLTFGSAAAMSASDPKRTSAF